MKFNEVIGQKEVCRHLVMQVREDRIPHAQLLCGPEGCGKFAIALAYATYLLCKNPGDDSCGECPSCAKINTLGHPDLHFIYPTIKKLTCDSLSNKWKDMISSSPYFTLDDWLEAMGAGNQQPVIYQQESDIIQQKISLSSSEGGRKVIIIWLPERMNEPCANKMLKLLEEPPSKTAFLLVSEEPERLLATIVSRTQRIYVPRIAEADLAEALQTRYGHPADEAAALAHRADGSLLKAMGLAGQSGEQALCFNLFTQLMRLAWKRDIRGMKTWSEEVAGLGRERQKVFLEYAQRMVRENFIANFHRPEMNYMGTDEQQFAVRFAPFIHEGNVTGITNLLAQAQEHVAQNVNARMVFFDVILNMTVLIKMKN